MVLPLVFVVAFFVLIYLLQARVKAKALQSIEYTRKAEKLLCAPGEAIRITTTITNKGLSAIPYISVREKITEDIINNFRVYLMPRTKLVRHVAHVLPARGRYTFKPASISVGDFIGITEGMESFNCKGEIVVYPSPATGSYIQRVTGSFLGDVSVRRFIMPDPILVTGFSEYTGREPMKAISWPQTLRSGQMMVKNYDYTTEMTATVVVSLEFLSTSKLKLPEGAAEAVEECLSIAHSFCDALEKARVKYDFFSNMATIGKVDAWSHVDEGYGKRHLMHILEGMGRASVFAREPLERLVMRVNKAQIDGANKPVVFIVPNAEDKVMEVVSRVGKGIKSVTVISAQREVQG